MKPVFGHLFKAWNLFRKVEQAQLRNFAKLASYEKHVTVLNKETLTGRLLLYLNNDNKTKQEQTASVNMNTNSKNNYNLLYSLKIEELFDLLRTLDAESGADKREMLTKLDLEFCLRMSDLNTKNILNLLNLFMNLIPNEITKLKTYHSAIRILRTSLPNLSKNDFLQFIFFVALQKKSKLSQEMHRACLAKIDSAFIEQLRIEELCIICNSTFKTSTKIANRALLNKIKTCLYDNLHLLKDSALFVTFLKTIRHNRDQDDDLLATISCAVFFNKALECYSFPTLCHILALYADHFYYDRNVLEVFTQKCIDELKSGGFVSKNEHLSAQLRGKDINRFVWVLAMFSDMHLVGRRGLDEVVVPTLIRRIEKGEFERDLGSLIDIALNLCVLNYRPHKLVPYIFSNRNKLWEACRNPKQQLRLNLLLQVILVEDPLLYRKIGLRPKNQAGYPQGYQIRQRPQLQRLLRALTQIRGSLGVERFEIGQQVPHLNILGIIGYKNGKQLAVNVELLDEYNRIRNVADSVPVGLMSLKLRLLENSSQGLLVVSDDDIEDLSDLELNEFLKDELNLIC